MREDVREALAELKSSAWSFREDSETLARIAEIGQLAQEQNIDDVPRVDSRFAEFKEDAGSLADLLWPHRTLEQRALEAGLEPFLNELTPDERALVSWVYDRQISLREIGREYLGMSHVAVSKRLRKIHDKLRARLLEAFPVEEEDHVA